MKLYGIAIIQVMLHILRLNIYTNISNIVIFLGPSGSQSLSSKLVTSTIPSSSYDNKSAFNHKCDRK